MTIRNEWDLADSDNKAAKEVSPCPNCSELPKEIPYSDGSIKLECELHGHVALGANLHMAVQHWNRYVDFVARGMK